MTTSDFGAYRVYYARGTTVTAADSVWTTAKDANLANLSAAGTSVRGLVASDTYTFAVVWRDAMGNESPLSNTLSCLTNAMQPADDPASDGRNIAHRLDGTEALQDTDITITMWLTSPPTAAGSAAVYYDVGGYPDGPGTGNTDERRVALIDSADGDPHTWTAVIPGDDAEVVDGALVRYVGVADGFVLTNGGLPYAFRVDSTPPAAAGNPLLIDNGTLITVVWTPVTAADFSAYRIYCNTVWPARAGSVWDSAADAALGAAVTSGTTLTGRNAASNYYVNIATVDAVGNEQLLSNDLILYRQVPGAATAMTYLQGNAAGSGEVYAGESRVLAVTVTDSKGLPVTGETVRFALTAGNGIFNDSTAVQVASGLDGVARATLVTGSDPTVTAVVRASAGNLSPVDFSVQTTQRAPAALALTVPAVMTTDDTILVTVTALTVTGVKDDAWQGRVTLTATEGGATAGTLTGLGTITLVHGVGSWQLHNREAEQVTLTARSLTLTPVTASAGMAVRAGAAATLILTPPATATAGGTMTVTVRVADAAGNLRSTDTTTTVQVTVDGNAYAAAAGAQRVANGSVQVNVNDLVAETVTVRATSAGLPAVTAAMTVLPAAAVKAVAPAWVSAATGSTVALAVEIRDAYGNRSASDNGRTVTLGVSGTAQVLAATTTVAGVARFVLTDSFAGDVTLTPVAAGLATVTGVAHFYSGTDTMSTAVAVYAPTATLAATAGDTLAVVLQVVDGYNQPDATASGRELTVSGGSIPLRVITTGGIATLNLCETRAATLLLTVTTPGLRSCTLTVLVQPAAPERVRVVGETTVACNQAAALQLALVDAFGNVLDDDVSLADLEAGRGTVGNTGALINGMRTLTVITPQSGLLPVVPVIGNLRGETLNLTVQSGAAAVVTVQLADTALLGETLPLVLEVRDAAGNCVATDNGRAITLLISGKGMSPAQTEAQYTANGKVVTTLSATGTGVVRVYPIADGLTAMADTVVFSVPVAVLPARVAAVAGAGIASIDDTVTVTVTVYDATSAVLTADQSTAVRLMVTGGARVVENQPLTVVNGVARFHLTTDTVGVVQMTPVADGLSAGTAAVIFAAGVPVRVRVTGAVGAMTGSTAALAVQIEDRMGNIPNGAWPVALAATGSAQVTASVTTAAGRASAAVTDAVAETVSVIPTVAGLTGVPHLLCFAASTPQRLALTLPATATCGGTLPVTVRLFDGLGNAVAGAGTVRFMVTAGTVTPDSVVLAGTSLTANLTLSAAGPLQVNAQWQALTDTQAVLMVVPPQTGATLAPATDVTVTLPAGVINDSCYVVARTGAAAAAGLNLGGVVGDPLELFLIDAANSDTVTGNFPALVTVEVAYDDADQNGVVDGTAVAESTLQLYRWESNAWAVVADGGRNAADAARNVVVADLRHFSQYAIRVSTDTGAVGGEIVAYPNPWKSTYASRRIVFANVPTGVPVRLRIFTINGEKVADQELTLGVNQRLEWDLCNDSGKEVASGIYVYVLTCNGVEKISKLAIIR